LNKASSKLKMPTGNEYTDKLMRRYLKNPTKKSVKISKKNIKIIKTLSFEKKLDHRILDNNKMKKLHFTVDNRTIYYHLKKNF
jgi:hypothetical protein